MEASGRDRGGEDLVEANATRGAASGSPGNTGSGGTDPTGADILEAAMDGRTDQQSLLRLGQRAAQGAAGERNRNDP